MFPALNIGASGLNTYARAVDVTANNIANAGRTGYHREEAHIASNIVVNLGNLQMGTGSHVDSVTRVGDDILEKRIAASTSEAGTTKAYGDSMSEIDDSLTEQSTQFQTAMDNFKKSAQEVAATPNSLAARQSMTESAKDFASKANEVSKTLGQQASDYTGRASASIDQANAWAKDLAAINKNMSYGAVRPNALTNDAVEVARKMADAVGGSYTIESNGQVTFNAANGKQMVKGDTVTGKVAVSDIPNLQGTAKGYSDAAAKATEFQKFYDTTVQEFSSAFNSANKQGTDMAGAAGQDFFSYSGGKLTVTGTPQGIAAGKGGGPLDNSNATALADQIDGKTTQTNTRSIGESYGEFIAKVGTTVASAKSTESASDVGLRNLQKEEHDTYGVNTEQELVKMMEYQRAYEANAKVIATADAMLGALINMKA